MAENSASAAGGEAWTTRRLLAWMSEAFAKAALESPRLQSEMLLAHVIGCPRLKLFTEPERAASEAERGALRQLVARALKHEPIDYLVGERMFFGLMFSVDRRVLVPRPSTETIVEYVLQAARRANAEGAEKGAEGGVEAAERGEGAPANRGGGTAAEAGERVFDLENRDGGVLSAFKPDESDLEEEDEQSLEKPVAARPVARLAARDAEARPAGMNRRGTAAARRGRAGGPAWRIADVCTGSGCMAVALAKHMARALVVATDVSTDALEVAHTNAQRHGVGGRVSLREGDLLAALEGEERFDVIVSNPPYIPDDEWGDVPANVKDHEPGIALRGGVDGLEFVRRLLSGAPGLLVEGGLLLVEVAASRAEEAAGLARGNGKLRDVEVVRDCEGLLRVVVARRK